jgi:Flp pilus assembly protein TadD
LISADRNPGNSYLQKLWANGTGGHRVHVKDKLGIQRTPEFRMLNKTFASAHYFLGYRAMRRGKWDSAVSHFSEAIRLLPTHPIAISDRGFAYQSGGNHRLAVRDFNRAIELAPNLAVAFYNRGISAKILGDYDWAVADQARAIALNPAYSNAYGEQGVAYTCKYDYDRAITSLTRAIELDPNEPSHTKHRGYALFDRGDFAASAADLRQSLKREPDPYAMLFCYLACARSGEGVGPDLPMDVLFFSRCFWPE